MNKNKEFMNIIKPYMNNSKFLMLKDEVHHITTNRYYHSMKVAYYSYKVSKRLGWNYKSVTKAALLHDFYLDSDISSDRKVRLMRHADMSLVNSLKHFSLSDMEMDIISSHMYPVAGDRPKYKESILVDVIDDVIALTELSRSCYKHMVAIPSFLYVVLINCIKF